MKPSFIARVTRSRPLLIIGVVGLLIALVAQVVPSSSSSHALASLPRLSITKFQDTLEGGYREATRVGYSAAQEQYANRAFPLGYVAYAQATAARKAFLSLPSANNPRQWQEFGGTQATQESGIWDYALNSATTSPPVLRSGRITALAIAPDCAPNHNCRVWVGAAGGGVWRTDQGLAPSPAWFPSSNGLTSNAIGSLIVDPTDPSGNTLYAGTGEANGASDSEAGVGLFKSTDGGRNWTLITGSVNYSKDRSIGAIAVDPVNPMHLFMGTDVARHGSSSVNGGRFTPPGAPVIGLYESTDGGATWVQDMLPGVTSDSVDPNSANGSDFFRGGVTKIQLDRTGLAPGDATRVFASVFDYGLFRQDFVDAGDSLFHQVFASQGGGVYGPGGSHSAGSRTEFSLAPKPNGDIRIYLGDTSGVHCGPPYNTYIGSTDVCAYVYVTDLGKKPALFGAGADGGPGLYGDWTKVSDYHRGTPGFTSFNYCAAQCSYDMPVYSPPGFPNQVYIAGQFQYAEDYDFTLGRTFQRSVDGGVTFTDMTQDVGGFPATQTDIHPDPHDIITVPGHPDLAFEGNDGGLYRLDGNFTDATSLCGTALPAASVTRLAQCKISLKAVPNKIYDLNAGLRDLQFQSVSINPQDPLRDGLGGTQDNGTWAVTNGPQWTAIGGDGGQSGIDFASPNIRWHTFYAPSPSVNFQGSNPLTWDNADAPLRISGEASSFYIPLQLDPVVSQTVFTGLQHVWRTKDSGGSQSYLDNNCSQLFQPDHVGCGDWVPIGQDLALNSVGTVGGNNIAGTGNYVVALARTTKDSSTLWAGTRRGAIWVSSNADAAAASVVFYQVDNHLTIGSDAPPHRFPSGIVVDPTNANHAWISYSGYNAYQPGGHVYEVTYDPTTHKATFIDISHNLGDMPLTGIQRDDKTGDLYVSTDFGVAMLPSGTTTWVDDSPSLPPVAVYGLTINTNSRVLYAATHGRSIWRIYLNP